MSERDLPLCARRCLADATPCGEEKCRKWIDYGEDLNCCLITIARHGKLTLAETAKRLDLSLVRIAQIEHAALKKLKKRID